MKRIVSNNNYVQLEEFNIYTNRYVLQLGFALSGLTYKIENRNVKFYLKEDYFYKNSVWSADIPLEINGTTYTSDNISDGLAALFGETNTSDVYTKEEVDGLINPINEEIDSISTELQGINSEIDALEQTVNGHTQDIDTINSEIVAINGKVDALEGKVDALESDNEANKTDIQDLKDSVSALRERVIALETVAAKHLVASNIKSGTNIKVDVDGNDVTISTTGIPTVEGLAELEEQVSANTDAIANKADRSDLEALSQQVGTNTSDIAGKAAQSDLNALSDNLANNYYNKTEVDQAIDDAIAGDADLTNYYTKTESDNKFQMKFTDVDDIQKVSALPSNPDSRTLYLIPVQ